MLLGGRAEVHWGGLPAAAWLVPGAVRDVRESSQGDFMGMEMEPEDLQGSFQPKLLCDSMISQLEARNSSCFWSAEKEIHAYVWHINGKTGLIQYLTKILWFCIFHQICNRIDIILAFRNQKVKI